MDVIDYENKANDNKTFKYIYFDMVCPSTFQCWIMKYEPIPLPSQLLNFLDPYYHKDYFQGERPITNKKADVSPWYYR